MATRSTDQTSWRIGLQPALVLAPVPDSIFRSEGPPPALVVEHREVADGDSERPRLEVSDSSFLDEDLVADLGFGERIDCHAGSMAMMTR